MSSSYTSFMGMRSFMISQYRQRTSCGACILTKWCLTVCSRSSSSPSLSKLVSNTLLLVSASSACRTCSGLRGVGSIHANTKSTRRAPSTNIFGHDCLTKKKPSQEQIFNKHSSLVINNTITTDIRIFNIPLYFNSYKFETNLNPHQQFNSSHKLQLKTNIIAKPKSVLIVHCQ